MRWFISIRDYTLTAGTEFADFWHVDPAVVVSYLEDRVGEKCPSRESIVADMVAAKGRFTCSGCGKRVKTRRSLRKHSCEHLKHPCDIPGCSLSFRSVGELRSHKHEHSTGHGEVAAYYAEEKWLPALDLNYEVSDKGRVRHATTKRLRTLLSQNGYPVVMLRRKGFLVHRLVASAFIPNPESKRTVNHLDKNRSNNRVENLEWATSIEQALHRELDGMTTHTGGTRPVVRLHQSSREELETYPSKSAAAMWLVSRGTAKSVCSGVAGITRACRTGRTAFGFQWENVEEAKELLDIEWRDIPGIPGYQVAASGVVHNCRGRLSKPRLGSGGYHVVAVRGTVMPVHRLVASAFLPNPEGHPVVNHKDGNKTNNNLCNLEWVTYAGNSQHAARIGRLTMRGVVQYDLGMTKIAEFPSGAEASRKVGLHSSTILSCCRECKTAGGFIFRYA